VSTLTFLRSVVALGVIPVTLASISSSVVARDRPFSTADLIAIKLMPSLKDFDLAAAPGNTGGNFSKEQIERYITEAEDAGELRRRSVGL